MNMKIRLSNNGGKTWVNIDKSYIKGFAFLEEDFFNEKELYYLLVAAIKQDTLMSLLVKLNGNFSAVITDGNTIYLIADKLKSFPLLYIQQGESFIITDQTDTIFKLEKPIRLNEHAIQAYLACGYLHGDMTFIENCYIVKAGSYVKINNKPEIHCYHQHIYKKQKKRRTEDEIINEAVQVMDRAFLRMIKSIGERPIFIPLSGGYDSRLLACLCKKFNIPNVSCFTYGAKTSYEVAISRQVAEHLGFPWYYVEYTTELKMKQLMSDEYKDYTFFAMNLNTTAHTQDFIAFKELINQGVIPNNAVIVPGHSGEILGGDQIPYNLLDTDSSIAQLIYGKYYTWNVLKKKYRKGIVKGLGEELNMNISSHDTELACDLFNNWNIQNRQANFIINAVRVYEYFGIDWRIPLWDDELSDFWLSVEWKQKYYQILYNKYMFERYFIPLRVAIYKKQNNAMNFFAKIKLPYGIKSRIKCWLCTHFDLFKRYYDPNNYYLWLEALKKKLDVDDMKYISFFKNEPNALIALYQVHLIRKVLN